MPLLKFQPSYFIVTGAALFGRTVMNDFWFPLRNPDVTSNILRFQCSLHEFEVKLHANVLFTDIRKKKILDRFFLTRTNLNPLSEAVRRAMAAKLSGLAQTIAALRHLVAESRTTCRSWSYLRQFGNILTGLYTLRDAVRTFIHTFRTFSHSPASSYQSERRFSAKAAHTNKTRVYSVFFL